MCVCCVCVSVYVYTYKEIYYEDWLTCLWRLLSPKSAVRVGRLETHEK